MTFVHPSLSPTIEPKRLIIPTVRHDTPVDNTATRVGISGSRRTSGQTDRRARARGLLLIVFHPVSYVGAKGIPAAREVAPLRLVVVVLPEIISHKSSLLLLRTLCDVVALSHRPEVVVLAVVLGTEILLAGEAVHEVVRLDVATVEGCNVGPGAVVARGKETKAERAVDDGDVGDTVRQAS